ncbi:hypothetical protein SAMN05216267_1005249 [Actinacidiphila rubida]|uniref:Tetratricopeptide repeat protein n=1 Tax=Actinacidiphila rubida TaxID=310780 RepID=A0A1H8GT68_9ACTN|nr:hypothetical protein SAMN05216267_1005249 [Actinacidiphila rubida]
MLSAAPRSRKETAGALSLTAAAVNAQGRHVEALAVFDEAVPFFEKVFGAKSAETLALRCNRGQVLAVLSRHTECERECADVARTAAQGRSPAMSLIVTAAQNGVVYALNGQGRHREAEALARDTLAGPVRPGRAGVDRLALVLLLGLARSLNGQERYDEALAVAERADELRRTLTEDLRRPESGTVELIMGNAFLGLGRTADAHAAASAAHDACLATFGPEHHRTVEAQTLLARLTTT